jgi:hypothetical protein
MRQKTVRAGGHTLEIGWSMWTGKERITMDGRVVSEKRSYLHITPHSFTLREGSADVVYEVNVLSNGFLVGYIVRRNGIIVAHEP